MVAEQRIKPLKLIFNGQEMESLATDNSYPFYSAIVGSWFLLVLLIYGSIWASFTAETRESIVKLLENQSNLGKFSALFWKVTPVLYQVIGGYLAICIALFCQIASYFSSIRDPDLYLILLLVPPNCVLQVILIKYLRNKLINRDVNLQRIKTLTHNSIMFYGTKLLFTRLWFVFATISNISTIIQVLFFRS
jgi:hypothetical protein